MTYTRKDVMTVAEPMKAPFPWFGGKSAIADVVWKRFRECENYVEPFFGSGAVLLARPRIGKTETINDKDHFVANFWRSVQRDPDTVAAHADWPVNEADLHSRHWWLLPKAPISFATSTATRSISTPRLQDGGCGVPVLGSAPGGARRSAAGDPHRVFSKFATSS